MTQPEAAEHRVLLRGLPYRLLSWSAGTPVLMLHGFTGGAVSWKPLAQALSGNHQVVAVDLPGHGGTSVPPDLSRIALPEVAADLASLIAQLAGGRAALIGYSMGGRLALATALLHPQAVSALIMESASPGLRTAHERYARLASDLMLADHIEAVGAVAFLKEWNDQPLFAGRAQGDPAALRALTQAQADNHAAGLAASLRSMSTGAQPSYWDALGALSCRVLLVTGERDEKYSRIAAEMAAHMPKAAHVMLAGAGHTPHIERSNDFAKAAAAFLEEIDV